MPSSNHPDEGWVKIFFDPPYDMPTSEWKTSREMFGQWRRDLSGDQYGHVTLWTATMIIYDTRSKPGNSGRIIIAVKKWIPGYPVNTSLRTIAELTWEIPMCASAVGCKRGWSDYMHRQGRTDNAGTIHWTQADARATRRGVRNLAKLIAIAYNSHWRKEPAWMRLYLTNVWATIQIKDRLHYRVRASWSNTDRQRAKLLAYRRKRKIRTDYRNFYMWLYRGGA